MAISIEAAPKNSALRKARQRRDGQLIPGVAHLETTYRCNLRCLHCYLEPHKNERKLDELSTSEWAGIFKQLFEMGVYYVTFSGGEPLCRPDIFKIMHHAKEQGLFFGIKTNGTLITESVADTLKELGTFSVDVSLYGAAPATHEHVTGVADSYVRTIRAIKLLRECKVRVVVNTTLMKCNVAEQAEIEHIAQQLGAMYSPDPLVFPKVGQPGSASSIRMDDDQLRTLIRERNWDIVDADQMTTDLKRHLICGAGKTRCAISPQGEVFPCTLWRIPLGDLRQQTLKDIWYGASACRIRAIGVSDLPLCASCEFVSYCARCPGLVHMENGGISGPSSENCRLARALKGGERWQKKRNPT